MAKIVICSEELIRVQSMIDALNPYHDITFCIASSTDYNEQYLSTFDLIMDYRNGTEYTTSFCIKNCSKKGIPVIAGGTRNSTGSIMSLGMAKKPMYYSSGNLNRIINVSDVLTCDKKIETGAIINSGDTFMIREDLKIEYGIEILSVNQMVNGVYDINTAIFRQGSLNVNGEVFGSDCAFIGFPFSRPLTEEAIQIVNDIISWLVNRKDVVAQVKDEEGNLLSHCEIQLCLRKTGEVMMTYTTDENGQVSLRIRPNHEYYAVAFDQATGNKNAAIIDNIKV